MTQQIELGEEARADENTQSSTHEVLPDVAYQRLAIVNLIFIGWPQSHDWVLIDAGPMGATKAILGAARERFGDVPPRAIVMTHGHFDHYGSLENLLKGWKEQGAHVPVYVHELEAPYFRGESSYPPPDPGVGGGIMPLLSPLFPRSPVDVSEHLQILPSDGTVPSLPGWKWVHTPGHTPGHVSYWREENRALVVGDAFITTNQESAYAVATQKTEMHGPPMYFTQDFDQAKHSVDALASLELEIAITGHGRAMQGNELRDALHQLSSDFYSVAVPEDGKYVKHPAKVENGSAYDEA